jgi:hypothetical protein
MRAVDGDLGPAFGEARLDCIGPGRIDMAALQEGIAFAHRALIPSGRAGVARRVGQNEPVVKAPPFAGAATEDAVHVRGQPDNADDLCQFRCRGRRAVEPHDPLRSATGRVQHHADPVLVGERRGNGPAAG